MPEVEENPYRRLLEQERALVGRQRSEVLLRRLEAGERVLVHGYRIGFLGPACYVSADGTVEPGPFDLVGQDA